MSKKSSGCFVVGTVLLGIGMLGQTLQSTTTGMKIALVVAAGTLAIWLVLRKKRSGPSATDRNRLLAQATLLENLATNIPYTGSLTLALQTGEVCVARLNSVNLIEMRSNGSRYEGGSQGFSFRIMKGVSYRVGGSRGTLTKNPETMKAVDSGSAVFTNARVIFTGASATREWRFDKMLNVDVSPNGAKVLMSVSNRQKTSGLQTSDWSELTPGVLVAVANDFYSGGMQDAVQRCTDTAHGIRAMLDGASASESTSIANPAKRETSHPTTLNPETADNDSLHGANANQAQLQPGTGVIDAVGASFYSTVYDEARATLGASPGDTVEVTATLLAEPYNNHSTNGNAVAIQLNGKTLGYISEYENTMFFQLLTQSNGSAQCKAILYFATAGSGPLNSLKLSCELPPKLAE